MKYTKFENNNEIFELDEVLSSLKDLRSVLIHIPDYAVNRFLQSLSPATQQRLSSMSTR